MISKTAQFLRVIRILKLIEFVIFFLLAGIMALFFYTTGGSDVLFIILTCVILVVCVYVFQLVRLAHFSRSARWWVIIGSFLWTVYLMLILTRPWNEGIRFIFIYGPSLLLNIFVLVYLNLPTVAAEFKKAQPLKPSPVSKRNWTIFAVIVIALFGLHKYNQHRVLKMMWERAMQKPLPAGISIHGGTYTRWMDYGITVKLKVAPEAVGVLLDGFKEVSVDRCGLLGMQRRTLKERLKERYTCYRRELENSDAELLWDKKKSIYTLQAWGD